MSDRELRELALIVANQHVWIRDSIAHALTDGILRILDEKIALVDENRNLMHDAANAMKDACEFRKKTTALETELHHILYLAHHIHGAEAIIVRADYALKESRNA